MLTALLATAHAPIHRMVKLLALSACIISYLIRQPPFSAEQGALGVLIVSEG
jgi:hypothetical protein